jgi:hypothetical protein
MDDEQWRELCARVANEYDSRKLLDLVNEVIHLLEQTPF